LSISVIDEEEIEKKDVISFTSPVMKVFIEDTDAYGIMYNGNYLRSYDRALHMSTVNDHMKRTSSDRVTTQHEGWSIVSIGYQKFSSSPALGGDFIVQGTLTESSEDLEIWDMQMTSPKGDKVYNSIKDLKIAKPKNSGNIFSLQHIEPFSFHDYETSEGTTNTFTVYRDEIDAHWTGHIPLRGVLNLCERARSNLLGGPSDLQKLQKEDGILVVVTSIEDCSLIDENTFVHPGQSISVETSFVIKRKGMIVECYQTLKSDNHDSRLAQGKITLMMINDSTRRPTSKLPEWVKQKLGLS
jgi:acyl-CoA thioesterase FadM